jgi:hypothetical protein
LVPYDDAILADALTGLIPAWQVAVLQRQSRYVDGQTGWALNLAYIHSLRSPGQTANDALPPGAVEARAPLGGGRG